MEKYIREMTSFEGKPIRLIACQSGAKAGGAAQQVADALGLTILAPTEIVNVNDLGEMFLSDNIIRAEMWFKGEPVQPTGKWVILEPRR